MESVKIKYKNRLTADFAEAKANVLRTAILNTADTLTPTVTGKIWYISAKGDDKASGDSSACPWGTLSSLNLNSEKISAGDAVLFERGSIFRGTFRAIGGVYYGAYGKGAKPCIYGSARNYAEFDWKEDSTNIWTCGTLNNDAGTVVFNHGEFVGFKKTDKEQLKKNGDFWCDGYTFYMYMENNPASLWESIEIGERTTLIGLYDSPIENITIENLCLKYGGGHGIAATDGAKNITVKNCEFGYLGGSFLHGSLRYGNAIEFYDGCENILVENNWIYQIYDSGITFQGGGNFEIRNIAFCNNLIEYCGMGSIEYWMAYNHTKGDYNSAENVTYANNIMRCAGYCWGGEQRPDKVSAHILSNGRNQNHITDYSITGNIFDRSTCDLLEITSLDNTYPQLSDNIYIQNEGMRLGSFAESRDVIFDSDVEKTLTEEWGEDKATVIYC